MEKEKEPIPLRDIPVERVQLALLGGKFDEMPGLVRMKGDKICRQLQLLEHTIKEYSIDKETEYVVLYKARVTGTIKLEALATDIKIPTLLTFSSEIAKVQCITKWGGAINLVATTVSKLEFKDESIVTNLYLTNCIIDQIDILQKALITFVHLLRCTINLMHCSEGAGIIGLRGLGNSINSLKADTGAIISEIDFFETDIDTISFANQSTCQYLSLSTTTAQHMGCVAGASIGKLIIVKSSLVKLEIADADLGSVEIVNEGFCGSIEMETNAKPTNITAHQTGSIGNLDVHNCKLNEVTIYNSYLRINLVNTQISSMSIIDCRLPFFSWGAGVSGEISIQRCKFLFLLLCNTVLRKDSVLLITQSKVSFFILQNLVIQGQLIIRKLSPCKKPLGYINFGLDGEDESKYAIHQDAMQKMLEPIYKQSLLEAGNQWLGTYTSDYTKEMKAQHDTHMSLSDHVVKKIPFQFKEKSFVDPIINNYRKQPAVFRISYVSLGKTEIIDCKLAGFRFEFNNSKLQDCFISGNFLNKTPFVFIHSPNPDIPVKPLKEMEQKANLYTQLKKVFEQQGNIVDAGKYHAFAMEHQKKMLQFELKEIEEAAVDVSDSKWKARVQNRLKRLTGFLFGQYRFDIIAFSLNNLSNRHGESWGRALGFIFLTSLPLYSLYFLSIHSREPFSFEGSGRFLGDYFSFLDFTHRTDFHVPKEQLTALSKFIDYLGKAVIGYGLFQLVAAFRKHGKKIS